jgi:hypothetical protein
VDARGVIVTIVEMSGEQPRALFKNLEGTSDQRKAVELNDVLLGILHRLDDGTSKLKANHDHLLAIEIEMRKRGSRGGLARYLVAICIGVAATLAWQSYGEIPKQIIAAKAPELSWSAETKPTQVAAVAQTVPAAVIPKAPAVLSVNAEQVHQITVDLAALGRTVDQLAASQDQMVHQIDMLQTSNQEILTSNREVIEKLPAPSPPAPTVAPTRKPTASRRPYP